MATMLGSYGAWAARLLGEGPGGLSLRHPRWLDVAAWRAAARARLADLLREPHAAAADLRVHGRWEADGLEVEELSWQLPYGPRTSACLLKPAGARGRLPAALALHDHGGFKYLGWRKIVRSQRGSGGEGRPWHPLVAAHQRDYYGDRGWPDELARRGFVVLAHDGFAFGSRRVLARDLPGFVVDRMMRAPLEERELTPEEAAAGRTTEGFDVPPDEPPQAVARYNAFSGQHESILAKSLFCAGLTWPGVTLAEDRAALAYLASRPDVDAGRIACCGLSGGGLRTCFLAGTDDRIRAAVTVGFLTTWRDFLLNVSHTHTWMIYVPGLPPDLDFPEILGLRAPLAALALSTTEDPLYTRFETERAGRMLDEVYRKAGAPGAFRLSWHAGPHWFTRPMQEEAFAWIGEQLG